MDRECRSMVDAYDAGKVDRRQLIAGLGAIVAAAMHGTSLAQSPVSNPAPIPTPNPANVPTFNSVGLNHIALRVPDVAKARDFYVQHLGCKVLRDGASNCFLACGDNHFVALFRADTAGLDHYCYTVEGYDPGKAVEALRAAGLTPERQDDRVYFKDLNGIEVQLASEWGDYPGRRP